MSLLPITAKLIPSPRRMRNLVYLAEIAALTRLTTGLVRVNENRPSKLKTSHLNGNEKRLALVERFFVEIIGTIGNIFTLHLGQDLANKLLEKRLTIPQLSRNMVNLSEEKLKATNLAIQDVFGENSKGLISRILYGKDIEQAGKMIAQKANLATLREKLGDEVFAKIRPYVEGFVKKANRQSSYSVLIGVVASALFAGFGIQWLNDRIVSPLFTRYFKMKYGNMPSSEKTKQPVPIQQPMPTGQVKLQQPLPHPPVQAKLHQLPVYSNVMNPPAFKSAATSYTTQPSPPHYYAGGPPST